MQQIRHLIHSAEGPFPEVAGESAVAGFRRLTGNELQQTKRAYTTARFDLTIADQLLTSEVTPKAGDLVLARVVRLGHHRKLESPEGRRQTLFVDDLVLVCYGARYASDQFESLVPDSLAPCSLVAAGGIVGICSARHASTRRPTEIEPLGLVADAQGRVLNLADCAEPRQTCSAQQPFTLAVVGSSMNAGKTTTVASMIRGLAKIGLRVGAAKITGTGAGSDRWAMIDAAIAALGREGCDVVVVELADGLLFPETAKLVEHGCFQRLVSGVVLAASDSMSAGFGADWLLQRRLPLLGIAGKLTSSPLMMREAAKAVDLPLLTLEDLESGKWTQRVGRGRARDAA